MRIGDVGRRLRHVAVGTTREDAAAAFGLDHDDVLLTTYADLADEVDLDQVVSLDLAAGEALAPALDVVEAGAGHVFAQMVTKDGSFGYKSILVVNRNQAVQTLSELISKAKNNDFIIYFLDGFLSFVAMITTPFFPF